MRDCNLQSCNAVAKLGSFDLGSKVLIDESNLGKDVADTCFQDDVDVDHDEGISCDSEMVLFNGEPIPKRVYGLDYLR